MTSGRNILAKGVRARLAALMRDRRLTVDSPFGRSPMFSLLGEHDRVSVVDKLPT